MDDFSDRKMKDIVAKFQNYVATYTRQEMYQHYIDETFINDMLYGIGIALSDDYQFAQGFDKFKKDLKKELLK